MSGVGRKPYAPVEPEWMKVLAPNSFLQTKDVAAVFGYKTARVVIDAVEHGRLPKPDSQFAGPTGVIRSYWKASTIRKELKRRAAN